METALVVSSALLWLIVILNLLLTLALVRHVNAGGGVNGVGAVDAGGLSAGERARAFSAPTLEGETVTLESYTGQGRAAVLLFISAGCQPCHKVLAILGDLLPGARQSGTDLILVSSDEREQTQAMLTQFQLDIPVLLAPRDSNPFFADYNITGTPSYCVIDEDGTVQSTGHPSPSSAAWKALTATWTRASKLAATGRR